MRSTVDDPTQAPKREERRATFPNTRARHVRAAGSPPGLLHAVGSSRRCGVVIALESGELPIPDRPHVCLRIDNARPVSRTVASEYTRDTTLSFWAMNSRGSNVV